MSDVIELPIGDDAAAISKAMAEIRARQTAMRLARIRREAANDNRKPVYVWDE
jgi:hypothetical protein